jgi:hypothetical protein
MHRDRFDLSRATASPDCQQTPPLCSELALSPLHLHDALFEDLVRLLSISLSSLSLFWCVYRDDFSMINADYATIFTKLPLEKVNQMEVHLLHLFDFSVEITPEEYEKMNKTIQELNNAATIMHLKMVARLPPPLAVDSSAGVSISGRIAFPEFEVIRNLEEEYDYDKSESMISQLDECSAPDEDTPDHVTASDAHFFPDLKNHSPKNLFPHSSTKPIYLSTSGSFDIEVMAPFVINEQFESIPEDPFEETQPPPPPPPPRRRTPSLQKAIDNALSVLVKYFSRSSSLSNPSKVHVTNETEPP